MPMTSLDDFFEWIDIPISLNVIFDMAVTSQETVVFVLNTSSSSISFHLRTGFAGHVTCP